MIKTSYFGKYKGENAIAISLRTPKWFKGKHLPQLAPDQRLLYDWKLQNINEKKYTKRFKNLIHSRNIFPEIIKSIPEDAVLLCWEKTGRFCHRNIIAELFRKHGVDVEEMQEEKI